MDYIKRVIMMKKKPSLLPAQVPEVFESEYDAIALQRVKELRET